MTMNMAEPSMICNVIIVMGDIISVTDAECEDLS
jgi:hypothetical protein